VAFIVTTLIIIAFFSLGIKDAQQLGPLVMPNAPSVFFWLNFVRENKTGGRFKNQEIILKKL
jgi:hypothetical protein